MNSRIIAKCNHWHARGEEDAHTMYTKYALFQNIVLWRFYEMYIFAVPVVVKNTIVVFDVFHKNHALIHNIR